MLGIMTAQARWQRAQGEMFETFTDFYVWVMSVVPLGIILGLAMNFIYERSSWPR